MRGFVRFEVGAGIEKKQENFAAEVMAAGRGAPERLPDGCDTPWNPAPSGVLYNGHPSGGDSTRWPQPE